MAGEAKQGTLHNAATTTGRQFVRLGKLPSMTLFFITITGGTAEVLVEISDDEILYIPVASITATCAVQIAIPASVVACNINSISGATVTVKYRTVVLENIPAETLLVYNSAGEVSSPVITPEQTILENAQVTRKKLFQVEIPASPTLLYTVPANKQTVIEAIMIVSTDVVDRTVSLWHDGSADVNIILNDAIITPRGFANYDGLISMQTGDTFYADSDSANSLTITGYGYEQGVPA